MSGLSRQAEDTALVDEGGGYYATGTITQQKGGFNNSFAFGDHNAILILASDA